MPPVEKKTTKEKTSPLAVPSTPSMKERSTPLATPLHKPDPIMSMDEARRKPPVFSIPRGRWKNVGNSNIKVGPPCPERPTGMLKPGEVMYTRPWNLNFYLEIGAIEILPYESNLSKLEK